MMIWENGIIREMTSEEMGQIHKSELLEKSRPLTADEVSRLFIMQNINTVITDDATASRAVELHPGMQYNGSLIRAKTRINWNGNLKRASVDLWDTESNNPDNAPTLWEDIAYRDGFRIIPEVITATLAFFAGECGWWQDKLYRSKVNGNVYNPAVYADNWEDVLGQSESSEEVDTPVFDYAEYVPGEFYYTGDKISFSGKNYICSAPDCVVCTWSPDEYPAYWNIEE